MADAPDLETEITGGFAYERDEFRRRAVDLAKAGWRVEHVDKRTYQRIRAWRPAARIHGVDPAEVARCICAGELPPGG